MKDVCAGESVLGKYRLDVNYFCFQSYVAHWCNGDRSVWLDPKEKILLRFRCSRVCQKS